MTFRQSLGGPVPNCGAAISLCEHWLPSIHPALDTQDILDPYHYILFSVKNYYQYVVGFFFKP
jgi:hypothetical protein